MPRIAATLAAFSETELAGFIIDRIDRTDGMKMIFTDGSWLLLRASGTENVVRVYSESSSRANVAALLAAGKDVVERS
jgi:phosphomannomutase